MLPESFGGRIIYLLQQYGPSFLKGAGVSMWLALVGTLFGCIIGFLVGIVQTIPVDKNDSTAKKVIIKVVKFIMACYVEFFRGTPMMAQAMFIYFGSAYLLTSICLCGLQQSLLYRSTQGHTWQRQFEVVFFPSIPDRQKAPRQSA